MHALTEGIALLNPQGWVGLSERVLMIHAIEFMLIVAIPVYFLLFFFAWRYRAGNPKKPKYMPNWEHAKIDELIWWAIPLEIVLVLGALTWTSTHQLDPRVPLEGGPPLVIEVVALDWKWLFIYPEQNIATVNAIDIPIGRPVRFEVTADAPMNSFLIPALGGQIYAMTGMVNPINLVADHAGVYQGISANYSGEGFAQMKFAVSAVPQEEFDAWVARVKASSGSLTHEAYADLSAPSVADEPLYYAKVEPNLYDSIVMKFMGDMSNTMEGHTH
jgi:cytochrome o ubiquinol oxidase subunit 2